MLTAVLAFASMPRPVEQHTVVKPYHLIR
jgi:hypothetical protein